MFCGECGTQNPDTNQFCRNCGKPLRKPQAPLAQPAAAPPHQPPAPPAVYSTAPAAAPSVPVKMPMDKGMLVLALAGMAAGIGSWFRYPYLLAIPAMVLGCIVMARTGNRKGVVAIVAVLAILIGLACIVVDIFYFTIFPPQPVDL